MLRFILAIILIVIIFKISQENVYVSFSICVALALMFMFHTNNIIEHDDIQFERDMLKTSKGRQKYYNIIYSQ